MATVSFVCCGQILCNMRSTYPSSRANPQDIDAPPLRWHIERLPVFTIYEIRQWPPNQKATPICRQPRTSPSSQSGPNSVRFLSHLHLHRLLPATLPSNLGSPSNDVPFPSLAAHGARCRSRLPSISLSHRPDLPRHPHLPTQPRPTSGSQ